jgi:hypothetical protein
MRRPGRTARAPGRRRAAGRRRPRRASTSRTRAAAATRRPRDRRGPRSSRCRRSRPRCCCRTSSCACRCTRSTTRSCSTCACRRTSSRRSRRLRRRRALAGEPVLPRTLDDSDPPAPGASPELLARFVHLADTQLSDDESPARLVTSTSQSGAFRPEEGYLCRMLNATVRTINRLHEDLPLDFVLLGGDNTDNAQTNELEWFMGVLGARGGSSATRRTTTTRSRARQRPEGPVRPGRARHPVALGHRQPRHPAPGHLADRQLDGRADRDQRDRRDPRLQPAGLADRHGNGARGPARSVPQRGGAAPADLRVGRRQRDHAEALALGEAYLHVRRRGHAAADLRAQHGGGDRRLEGADPPGRHRRDDRADPPGGRGRRQARDHHLAPPRRQPVERQRDRDRHGVRRRADVGRVGRLPRHPPARDPAPGRALAHDARAAADADGRARLLGHGLAGDRRLPERGCGWSRCTTRTTGS